MNQSLLRDRYKKIRSAITADAKKEKGMKLCKKIEAFLPQYKTIALFANTVDEPNIMPLLGKKNNRYVFPKVISKQEMQFFLVSGAKDLEKGFRNIYEPKEHCPIVNPQEIDIFCIPGVLFDTFGNRIGMGGGYYDRYLSAVPNAKKWGICFTEQVIEEKIPVQNWDISMDRVLYA